MGDILIDLDPSKVVDKEFARLYYATVHYLEKDLNDGDFKYFIESLERVDAQRHALRARIQDLVEPQET